MRATFVLWSMLFHLSILSHARAQTADPWGTTLSMTKTNILLGQCNVVALFLYDSATREWPRGPSGNRIAMADFDLSVSATTPQSAVGLYNGPNHYSVCACSKGPIGTIATVTATYPSATIAPRAKVAGLAFTTSLAVPIADGRSSGNWPGCGTPNVTAGGPWTVIVQPTFNALPIGTCAAVQLIILDATGKDIPRNPLGNLITIADFDMSTGAAHSGDVYGEFIGPTDYSVCACQSGTVGESATLTAKYPAQGLASRLRVPGVGVQSTATLSLAAAASEVNLRGCKGRSSSRQVESAKKGKLAPGQSPASDTMPSLSPVKAPRAAPPNVPPPGAVPLPIAAH